LDPLDQCAKCLIGYVLRADTAAAMLDAGRQEKPGKVAGALMATVLPRQLIIKPGHAIDRNSVISLAMPVENLAAGGFKVLHIFRMGRAGAGIDFFEGIVPRVDILTAAEIKRLGKVIVGTEKRTRLAIKNVIGRWR